MFAEPSAEVNTISRQIVDAAIEVHRDLGPGYSESVYEEALVFELELRGIGFERQKPIYLQYKGKAVGEGRIDILVENKIVVELKAVETLLPVHKAQLISYLKTTGHPLGLLINFNVPLLKDGIRRVVLAKAK